MYIHLYSTKRNNAMSINQKINAKGNAVGMWSGGLVNDTPIMKRVISRANRSITFYDLHTPYMLLPKVWKTNYQDPTKE